MEALSVKDVWFTYDGPPVLQGATFSVARGEFACIVGPNGGGKTTLLKLMLGLLQPAKGTVRVLGQRPEQARRQIGYIPQHASLDLSFPISVLDVVLMGRLGHAPRFGPFRRKDKDKAREALDQVSLADLASRSFSALSGGQRQRVLLARALAGDPDVLLLDEPTAHVDMVVERELHALLRDLNNDRTVIMVTHDLAFVSPEVDWVVCVNRRVVVHPTSEVSSELIAEIYAGDVKLVRHDVGAEHHHHGGSGV